MALVLPTQIPLNTPGRFSIIARTPSLASSLLSSLSTIGGNAAAATVSPSIRANRADINVA